MPIVRKPKSPSYLRSKRARLKPVIAGDWACYLESADLAKFMKARPGLFGGRTMFEEREALKKKLEANEGMTPAAAYSRSIVPYVHVLKRYFPKYIVGLDEKGKPLPFEYDGTGGIPSTMAEVAVQQALKAATDGEAPLSLDRWQAAAQKMGNKPCTLRVALEWVSNVAILPPELIDMEMAPGLMALTLLRYAQSNPKAFVERFVMKLGGANPEREKFREEDEEKDLAADTVREAQRAAGGNTE